MHMYVCMYVYMGCGNSSPDLRLERRPLFQGGGGSPGLVNGARLPLALEPSPASSRRDAEDCVRWDRI